MRPSIPSLSLALASFTLWACSFSGVISDNRTENPTVVDAAVDTGGNSPPQESGVNIPVMTSGIDAAAASATKGSPLCNASTTLGCYPDNTTSAESCPLDAGIASLDGGVHDASIACRVTADPDGLNAQPICARAGANAAGQACTDSSECAAQLECVSRSDGTSACEPYCCSGTCASANDFCDVASVVSATQTATKVPVCVPIMHCQLLANGILSGACPSGETCSIVRDDGATSCEEIGEAKAGNDCDDVHCAAGLACIGVPGNRRCFQLCTTSGVEPCTAPQKCQGGMPLFPLGYGVCI
jgi:hypothetical protein